MQKKSSLCSFERREKKSVKMQIQKIKGGKRDVSN